MPGYRYPTEGELTPSADELARARKAAAAPGESTAIGGATGSVLGGALGALISAPSFGTLAPILIPAGAGLGGTVGSAIGGSIGNSEAEKDNAALDAAEMERQKKLAALKLRQEALDHLESIG
jgi:cation transporter-like permease